MNLLLYKLLKYIWLFSTSNNLYGPLDGAAALFCFFRGKVSKNHFILL